MLARLCRVQSVNVFQTLYYRRGIRTMQFGDTVERIIEREDFPMNKVKKYFENHKISVLGYGPQGRAQALNMRDNGLNISIGVRKFEDPINDGFVEGVNLHSIEEATEKGDIVLYLLSDAGQKEIWPRIKPLLTPNKTLSFSHGFGIVYGDQTGIVPRPDMDVILVAPKGTGRTLREKFTKGEGVNSSVAVHQDYSGNAYTTTCNLAFAIGSGYLYDTTFQNEVISDLVGERGALMGGIHGLFLAQYNTLRKMGHSPSEAFNETVEEATQSLIPLISNKGMEWMYANCSTTAQRGAIDWYPKFEKALEPIFQELYQNVKDGSETRIVLKSNDDVMYREKLNKELKNISDMEIWKVGSAVRSLRR